MSPSVQPGSSFRRSPAKAALYHLGRGLRDFGSEARWFMPATIGVAAALGIVSGAGFFMMASYAIPLALGVGAMGLLTGSLAGVGAGAAGDKITEMTKGHRTVLHSQPAESWRKAGVALAATFACATGVGTGYGAYKTFSDPDFVAYILSADHSKVYEASGSADRLTSAFVQGISGDIAVQRAYDFKKAFISGPALKL